MDQKNSEYGNFSHSEYFTQYIHRHYCNIDSGDYFGVENLIKEIVDKD